MGIRKKVLIIGMLNSIHFSNWLVRFKDEEVDFFIFPSRQYRQLDPGLKTLLKTKHIASYSLIRKFPTTNSSNFLDYLLETKWFNWIIPNLRAKLLSQFLKKNRVDFIHTLEIQNAGYLLLDLDAKLLKNSEVVVTNWGSDIFHFSKFAEHELKIRKVLSLANYYSAECFRDYDLATKLGFIGSDLPIIPNSFFYSSAEYPKKYSLTSSRNWVVVKGYGGEFGLSQIAIEVIEKLLVFGTNLQFFFYSVSQDVEGSLLDLQAKFPNSVNFVTLRNKISKADMVEVFSKSRIYIGCSRSDGVSTSFLEAMQHGTYPIQTNTSCASEWVLKGAMASIINPSAEELWHELLKAIKDDELVDQAQVENQKIALKYLNPSELIEKSKLFYNLV
jgi:glycosyltransferase involved in cell wall biosynthesis